MIKHILKDISTFRDSDDLEVAEPELRSAKASFIAGKYYRTLRYMKDAAKKMYFKNYEIDSLERIIKGMMILICLEFFV